MYGNIRLQFVRSRQHVGFRERETRCFGAYHDTPNDVLDFAAIRHRLEIHEDIPAFVNVDNLACFDKGELKQRIDIKKVSKPSTSLGCKQEGDVDSKTEEVRKRHEKRHEIIDCVLQQRA